MAFVGISDAHESVWEEDMEKVASGKEGALPSAQIEHFASVSLRDLPTMDEATVKRERPAMPRRIHGNSFCSSGRAVIIFFRFVVVCCRNRHNRDSRIVTEAALLPGAGGD